MTRDGLTKFAAQSAMWLETVVVHRLCYTSTRITNNRQLRLSKQQPMYLSNEKCYTFQIRFNSPSPPTSQIKRVHGGANHLRQQTLCFI